MGYYFKTCKILIAPFLPLRFLQQDTKPCTAIIYAVWMLHIPDFYDQWWGLLTIWTGHYHGMKFFISGMNAHNIYSCLLRTGLLFWNMIAILSTPAGLKIEILDQKLCHKWLGCMLSMPTVIKKRHDVDQHLQAASKAFFFFSARSGLLSKGPFYWSVSRLVEGWLEKAKSKPNLLRRGLAGGWRWGRGGVPRRALGWGGVRFPPHWNSLSNLGPAGWPRMLAWPHDWAKRSSGRWGLLRGMLARGEVLVVLLLGQEV